MTGLIALRHFGPRSASLRPEGYLLCCVFLAELINYHDIGYKLFSRTNYGRRYFKVERER
jgi:hypothetical protein